MTASGALPAPAFVAPADRQPQRALLQLPDGYETPLVIHPPADDGPTRLPVVYLHGIQSHPGWFYRSAVALADDGHAVYQPTRRGSGANIDARGHADSAKQLLDDLACAVDRACSDTAADRCHLLGVSWGGKLAAAYAAALPEAARRIASLTLIAPGICPQVDVGVGTKLAIGLCLLGRPRRAFDIPLNKPELFTDSEAMRTYLRNDPARLHKATARFLYVSRCVDRMLSRAAENSISVPTTLLLAGRDRIIDNARTRKVCERLCGAGLTVRELDGAHTLEFEPNPAAFLEAACAATSDDRTDVLGQS